MGDAIARHRHKHAVAKYGRHLANLSPRASTWKAPERHKTFDGEGKSASASPSAYRDPQMGKWRVFDTVEIEDDDDVGEGFNEPLATFAVSAAHLATLQG
jgi:hypothetical protein